LKKIKVKKSSKRNKTNGEFPFTCNSHEKAAEGLPRSLKSTANSDQSRTCAQLLHVRPVRIDDIEASRSEHISRTGGDGHMAFEKKS
jgi:hypothetical protein